MPSISIIMNLSILWQIIIIIDVENGGRGKKSYQLNKLMSEDSGNAIWWMVVYEIMLWLPHMWS